MAKKIVIPRIDAPIIDKNGNMSLAWYLYLSNLASKGGGGEPGSAATITITQDNEVRGTFLLNQDTDETIDLEGPKVDSVNGKQDVVVLDANDVGALPDTTLFTSDLVASIDTSTYVMTLTMKDQNGDTIGTPQTIDLPLETVVVDGEYDAQTKKIILTLVNGNTIEFSVADLVAGLQSEITSENKLHADLVDDSAATHKFVTASDKTTWNAKQDAISDLATIRSGAALGATAVQPNSVTAGTYTKVTVASNGLISAVSNLQASDIPDLSSTYYLASNPSGYQANVIETVKVNGTALTPSSKAVNIAVPTKVSDLTNDSGFISGITSSMVTSALGYTPYNSSNPSGYQANVIESVKVNGTALTITSKAVDVPVPTKVSDLTNDSGYITGISSTMVVSALGYTPVNPSSLATVATTGQYSDLSGKPTIPTVNNATLTIKRNGTSVGTFSANASTDKAIDITVPTKVTDLTDHANYVLSSSLSTVATTGSYNDLSNKPTIPTVNNPTITFMQGSTLVGTMTLNQSGNQTFTFAAGGSGSFSPDNTTITTVSGEAKVIAVKNQNTVSGALAQIKLWEGTLAQYNAQRQAETLDDDTLCIVKGVSDSFDWGSVAVMASNEQDNGSITSQATIGQDWGSITVTPDTTERMTLCMGGYTLGTYGEIT